MGGGANAREMGGRAVLGVLHKQQTRVSIAPPDSLEPDWLGRVLEGLAEQPDAP